VKADAVGARGVIVDEAEVIFTACSQLCSVKKFIEAFWYRPRRISGVSFIQGSRACVGVYWETFVVELGSLIKTKYSCPSDSLY
jgi:hypothetical protein